MFGRSLSVQEGHNDISQNSPLTPLLEGGVSAIGSNSDKFQGLRPLPGICGAVIDDYRRRATVYVSDFTDGFHMKTLSSFLFMFFATFASTVALGVVVDDRAKGTNKCMGVTELVLSLAIAGCIHSLVAGCPMAVLRPTGPITLFVIKLYGLSENLKIDFFEWFAWVGFWVGVYMVLIASFDLCQHIRLATRYLHDMFAFFVCTIYIHDGIAGVAGLWPNPAKQQGERQFWQDDNCATYGCAYFSIILFSITLFGALALNSVTSTRVLNEFGRAVIKDYALTIAVFVAIGVGYSSPSAQDRNPLRNDQYIPHITLPKVFAPTFNNLPEHNYTHREWWIGLQLGHTPFRGEYNGTVDESAESAKVCGQDSPCGFNKVAVFYAAIAAIPITFWFYFDQLFSCLLHQIGMGPNGQNLSKGAFYHSSFLWMGLFNMFLPMFGLPFVTASLPHSPQFVRALQIRDESTRRVTRVVDNRIAPFMVYLFCGLALFIPTSAGPKLLELIPKGVVYGILTFVGVAGVLPETGNQLSRRLLLLFSFPSEFPPNEPYTGVPMKTMHLYTFFQAGALIICWVITLASGFGSSQFWQYLGIFFPLWIVALIPIRKRVIPMFIREHELRSHLDTEDEQLADLSGLVF